jgi:cyclopropane-fatty-acyl-phospholipid synthase
MMRIAVVGAGVSVAVYEKEDCLGGHARTVAVDDAAAGDTVVHLDLGSMHGIQQGTRV